MVERGGVQPGVVDAQLEAPRGDGPGHLVPGQELVDEPLAVGVADQRPVAAQRLRQQRPGHRRVVERGRVELHELDVGDGRAGAEGHGDAVAGRQGGVGRHGEALPGAAGGDDRVAGSDLGRRPVGRPRRHAYRPSRLHEEVERQPALAHFCGCRLDRGDERPLDLGAGGVTAGVQHAGGRVAPFARQREPGRLAVAGLVEDRAHGDELTDALGAFGDEHAHRVRVAEAGAGRDGVGEVQLGRVVGTVVERGGDTTLRIARRGVGELAFREDDHRPAGASGMDGSRQAGDPTAEHQQVEHQLSLLTASSRGSP